METIVDFVLESAVSLGLLSLYYLLVSRKYNSPDFNRYFLIFALLFSMVIPFISISLTGSPQSTTTAVRPAVVMLDMVTIYGNVMSETVVPAVNKSQGLHFLYLIGFILLALRLVWALIKLNLITGKSQILRVDGHRVIITGSNYQPFTFLQTMVIPKDVWEGKHQKEVLVHESIHVKQKHSIDLVLLELILIIQWFNPFVWLMRRLMRENHEFLADKAVIDHGFEVKAYQKLLLYEVMGVHFELGNNLNHSLTKKRLQMMTYNLNKKWSYFSTALSVVLITGLVLMFACESNPEAYINPETAFVMNGQLVQPQEILTDAPGDADQIVRVEVDGQEHYLKPELTSDGKYSTQTLTIADAQKTFAKLSFGDAVTKVIVINENSPVVFQIVEQMPRFPGGQDSLMRYLSRTIKYPVIAQENGTQGRVFVEFIVSNDGSVTDVKIARSSAPKSNSDEKNATGREELKTGIEEIYVVALEGNATETSTTDPYISLDKEAMRVVKAMPKWEPGFQRGKPVNVQFMLPINFVLQGGKAGQKQDAVVKLHGPGVVAKQMIAGYRMIKTADELTLTGKVIDENDAPLQGASVILKGTSIGTSTDKDGNYRLPFNRESDIVVFSFVGKQTYELKINNHALKPKSD